MLHRTIRLLLVVLVAWPAAANACRGDTSLSRQIDEFREDGTIAATIVAEVTEIGPVIDGYSYVLGFARVGTVKASEGLTSQPDQFHFDDSRLTVGCGWSSNLSTWPGELLAVYLSRDENGLFREEIVLPLSDAIAHDPLVARLAANNGLRGSTTIIDRGHVRRIPRFDPVPVPIVPALKD